MNKTFKKSHTLDIQTIKKKITNQKNIEEIIYNLYRHSNNIGDICLRKPDFSLLLSLLLQESFDISRKKFFIIIEAFYQSILYLVINISRNISVLSSSTLFYSFDYVTLLILHSERILSIFYF